MFRELPQAIPRRTVRGAVRLVRLILGKVSGVYPSSSYPVRLIATIHSQKGEQRRESTELTGSRLTSIDTYLLSAMLSGL